MQLNSQGYYLLVVSENGMGKRTCISEFTCQNRGGKGVKCYKITEKTGNVVGAKAVNEENEIMIITTEGIITVSYTHLRFLADQEDFSEENIQKAGIEKSFENDELNDCVEEIVNYIKYMKQK